MAEDGETNEETLLQESACKEAYYMGRLLELQTEVTLSRSVASNAQAENERLNALVQELREVSWSTVNRVCALCGLCNVTLDKENAGNQSNNIWETHAYGYTLILV